MWTYKGVDVFPAGPGNSGLRWYARTTRPGRRPWKDGTPAVLRADTKQSMREMITHYQDETR